MDKILLVIGARGGSKGVKGKNIRWLAGKPLMAYTIQQASKWGKASHVVVSTDSAPIAQIAKRFGAQVPFMRPFALATDTASKVLVTKHALIECEKIYKEKYNIIVDLDVTSPVRSVEDLENCLKIFKKEKPKTLFSVVKAHKNPYFNMVERDRQGRIVLCKKWPKKIVRRQDAPVVYAMNASIYFYDREYLLKEKNPRPLSKGVSIYEMGPLSAVDIDSEIDFKFIEFLVKENWVRL